MRYIRIFFIYAMVTIIACSSIVGLFHVLMRISSQLVPSLALPWIPYVYIGNFVISVVLVWIGLRLGVRYTVRVLKKVRT